MCIRDRFFRGINRCSKSDRLKNDATGEELKIFNLIERLRDYKQLWKEHLQRDIQDWPKKSGNITLQDRGVWVDPVGDGWGIIEGGTGSTLPTL